MKFDHPPQDQEDLPIQPSEFTPQPWIEGHVLFETFQRELQEYPFHQIYMPTVGSVHRTGVMLRPLCLLEHILNNPLKQVHGDI